MLLKGIILAAFIVGTIGSPAPELSGAGSHPLTARASARLVGAVAAPDGSAPWAVSLTSGLLIRSHFCGASLISERHILTAAHCVASVYSIWTGLSSSLRAVVGTNRWNVGGTQYTIASNATHPHYVAADIKNDVGIFITAERVQLSSLVQPVQLNLEHVGGGERVRVTGWGSSKPNGAGSTVLMELYTETLGAECSTIVAQKAVELSIKAPPVEDQIEICTYLEAGKGNCHGDSGSALVGVADSRQVGVVSWGFPCALGVPDMFARVSGLRDFISSVLDD